jgi:hypothetical protein
MDHDISFDNIYGDDTFTEASPMPGVQRRGSGIAGSNRAKTNGSPSVVNPESMRKPTTDTTKVSSPQQDTPTAESSPATAGSSKKRITFTQSFSQTVFGWAGGSEK